MTLYVAHDVSLEKMGVRVMDADSTIVERVVPSDGLLTRSAPDCSCSAGE